MKAPYCCDRSACNQGRACPHRASQPSRSSWRASDLAIALIFVGGLAHGARPSCIVEDVVVAQIGMGQDVVADALARPQAPAMADHQPTMGTQHRKVIEMVGSKMKTDHSERQLSGLGFSSTQRNSLLCRVKGSFSRVIKIIF